jgi:NAD(P)-dependent dehydrogenase (short-subunit alcohol dehydrogenase family)
MGGSTGRVALVTGAAQGIGLAVARCLSSAGISVAYSDIDEGALNSISERDPANSALYQLDVSNSRSFDSVVDSVVRDFGRIDILINNAGLSTLGPMIVDTVDEDWLRGIAVMQSGVFYGMRAAGRHFVNQGSGVCVNISSIRGLSPRPGRIAYCAAKSAVLMMTRVAAAEWAPHGVRCNAIAPGSQRTPMWERDVAAGLVDEQRTLAVTPAGRLGEPEDVGSLAVYLCSDAATYINGAVITIDGALTSQPVDGDLPWSVLADKS